MRRIPYLIIDNILFQSHRS